MRHVREVLRLRTAGVGLNEIARRVGVAPSTVRLTLKRLANAGFSWPLSVILADGALEAALFAAVGTKQGHRRRAEPDWAVIHHELKRKHVTLAILWDEYILDDWGLEPLDAGARCDLYEILEVRNGRRSTILTSQIPSTNGTSSSATRLMPTPSSTASFTTPIASISPATA
jgi:hypothetical protein